MTIVHKRLLATVLAMSLLPPAAVAAKPAAHKHRASIKVHPMPHGHRWRGYGFLPGYRQPPDLTDWRERHAHRDRYEIRYWHDGQLLYGWGHPGFYRGRWNGGSFGPCWTYTPIGMMPTC